VVAVIGEKYGSLSWLVAIFAAERRQVCNQRLALVDRYERIVQPASLQDVGQRQARERAGAHFLARDRGFFVDLRRLGDGAD